ncbi:MAG: hypothetical protein ABFD96_06485, partial [Armatimonadia bacterium]
IDGTRYYCLFDDAMISMTYARTLAQGHGLVWYPGADRVEGFTNLLWTLYMAALHLTGLPNRLMSLLVQLSALALLALNLFLVYRLAQRLAPRPLAEPETDTVPVFPALAVLFVAFYQPILMWSLQGMEVAALAPLVTGCLLLATRLTAAQPGSPQPVTGQPDAGQPDAAEPANPPVARAARPRPLTLLYFLLGLGTLIRPDAAVVLIAISLFLIVTDRDRRLQHIIFLAATALLFLGGQTVFRIIYYHDLFPNTYYLKMTGYPVFLRLTRGLFALVSTAWNINWLLCLLPFGLLLLKPSREIKLILWVFLAQAAYSVYAGGDAWEWTGGTNRYLVIAMPAFLTLLALALTALGRAIAHCSSLLQPGSRSHRPLTLLAVLLLLAVTVDLSMPSNLRPGQEWPLLTPPLYRQENESLTRQALLVRQVTTPEASVGVIWAGVIPYFSERPVVDLFGKSDRHIARLAVQPVSGRRRFWAFYPGHMKSDMPYTLTQQRPDFIPLLFDDLVSAAGKQLPRDYASAEVMSQRMWWRKSSPYVRTDVLRRLAAGPTVTRSAATAQ